MSVWVAHDPEWSHARAFATPAAAGRYTRRHPELTVEADPDQPEGVWVARSPTWDRVRLFHHAADAVAYATHRRLLVEWLPLTPWWMARSGLEQRPTPPCRARHPTGHPLQTHP